MASEQSSSRPALQEMASEQSSSGPALQEMTPATIRKYQPLPEVPGKGKAKVTEEQVAHDLLSLQKPKKKSLVDQYIFQRRSSTPTGSSGHDEPSYVELGQSESEESEKVVHGADEGGQGEGQAGPDPGWTYPGNAGADVQSIPSPVVHAGSDREHMDLDVADVSLQPFTEQLDEGFTATAYLKVQGNLKLIVEEHVDKPSGADKNAETKVESMVTVIIQQDMSSIPPMKLLIIDLTLIPESPKVHQQFKPTATETTTTLPPPPAQQQSTAEAMMMKRIGELEHIIANLIQENKGLEDSSRKVMNRDHSQELAQDLAETRKKKKKSHESPKTPLGSPPHQPPPPPPPTGPFGASGAPGASGSSQVPPPPFPPSSTNQESQSKGSAAPSSLKTAATSEYQAWTMTDIRLRPSISLTPADLEMDEDMGPDEQAQSSDDEDIGSAHIPKVNLRQDWWKPFEEERPATPEPAWSIRPVISPHLWTGSTRDEELLSLNLKTWKTLLLKSLKSFILIKPLPLGGLPGQVTIQSDFFFNKDLEYLRYGSKGRRPALSISKMKAAYYPDARLEQIVPDQFWIDEECKYDIAAMYGHLNHLPPKDKKILTTTVNQWTRHLVITQCVEDFQLGIESYQTQLNLTKPQWDATGFEYKHDYTVIDSPRAVMFRDKYGVQMMMCSNEIHKFSDGTLQQIDEALDYKVKEFRINRMNPCLNTMFWTRKDVDRSKEDLPQPGELCWWTRQRGRLQTSEAVMDPVTHKFNPSSHSRSLNRLLFHFSRSFTHFYWLSHSELVDIEKVAVCSSLRSLKPKRTIESRAKRSSKIISLGHYSIILASSHTMKMKMEILLEPTSNKLLVANELTNAFGKPFEWVFNSLVHSFRALSALRRSDLRTASTAAKPCQGDSSKFYLITGTHKKPDGIFIRQDKYVAEILRKFGLTDGKSASTPIDTKKPLLKDPDGEDMDVHTYWFIDVSNFIKTKHYVCSLCMCSFSSYPKSYAIKRIFRYLKGKPHLGLWYPKDSPFNLVAYSDSDYAGASLDRKSTIEGYASEGFDQIINFLNASAIKYALTVNPNIYVSVIKQFWSSVAVKKVNDVTRLQALVELAKMGYEKPSMKLTFYKAFFSSQWKFFYPYNPTILVRNVDSSSKFCMYPRFLQLMIRAQVGDLSSHTTKYASLALTQKIFTNMRRVGKGFSRVETPLFEGMIVAQQANDVADEGVADVNVDDVPAADAEPTIPPPTPTTQSPPPSQEQEQPSTSHEVIIANMDADEDVTLKDVATLEKDAEVLSMQDDELEPAELKEVVKVVTTAKLMTKLVTAAAATITVVATTAPTLTTAPSAARRRKGVVIRDLEETATPSTIIHSEPKSKDKGKGIMVHDPKPLKKKAQIEQDEAYARELEAELNKNINWDDVIEHVKEKGRQDNVLLRFKMDYFKGMSYDAIRPIFEKYFNSTVAFLEKSKEQLEEEESRTLKRKAESSEEKAAKKQKLDEEVEELRKHLQIVPNDDDDDVYTEATPLALKRRLGAECPSSNLEESKKCPWFSKGQELETVKGLWSADYNDHYNTVDLAGREKISINKIYKTTTARRFYPTVMFEYILHQNQDQDKDQAG
nr:hypothetical protein [Tanacetum cinerariifolium]